MVTRIERGTKVQDGETFTVEFTVVDESGTAVDLTTAATAMALTFYNSSLTGNPVINSRNAQDVFGGGSGANNVTFTSAGVWTWKGTTADSTLGQSADSKVVARVSITYNDGAAVSRTAIQEITWTIEPLPTVT